MYFTQLLWLLNTNSDIDQLSASVSAYVIRMYIFRQPAFSDCLFYCCRLCNVYLLTCLPAPKSLFDRSWFLSPLYTLHKYSVCVCVCVKECEMFKLSPSVFVCHHPHTHSRSYFYSRLALCHITWQRGSPPVEHACSTCKNTTTAQRKYLTSLKKKQKKTICCKLQPLVSKGKWMNQQTHQSSRFYRRIRERSGSTEQCQLLALLLWSPIFTDLRSCCHGRMITHYQCNVNISLALHSCHAAWIEALFFPSF